MTSFLAISDGFLMRHRPSPSDEQQHHSDDLFRARLDQIIRSDHPLVRLADAMPWESIVEQVADLLPPTPEGAGRASLPVRMMVGLLYMKYAYNLSDDQVLERWLESPYMQYFTGEVYFQHELPCDPSSLTRWRNRLDEPGAEELLAQTIEAAKTLKAIRPRELRVVSIDTTVQEKNIAYPTDSRLLEVARSKLAEQAAEAGIKLRQSYARTGPRLNRQAGRYAHARQYKRMRRVIKRQRIIVGRLLRDIDRKATPEQMAQLAETMHRARRLKEQKTKSKSKLYAFYAPEVECISKGKARQPYEFGVKASFAVTAHKGLIVGARSFPGNPYDGDTLAEQFEQTAILADTPMKTALVDLGYRGQEVEDIRILHRGKPKRMKKAEKRLLKRRQAVEPSIGHLKADHRMRRTFLKGALGDAMNPILAAAGFNIRWLVIFWRRILSAVLRLLDQGGIDARSDLASAAA
ncbi:transposase [Spiribacter roseus]|nr:transposase [Spiribacter roseus]